MIFNKNKTVNAEITDITPNGKATVEFDQEMDSNGKDVPDNAIFMTIEKENGTKYTPEWKVEYMKNNKMVIQL
jgi:hypothetical protein